MRYASGMAEETIIEAPEEHVAEVVESSGPIRSREKRGIFETIERRLKKLKAWEIVGLSVIGTLALDHALSSRGTSTLARMFGASPPPCPPQLPRAPAARTRTGYEEYHDGYFE